jgi:hypothetical protein
MKFNYKRYAPDIVRPVILIELVHDSTEVPYEVLVDSGADECIFDAGIAVILGIDIKRGLKKSVYGITGETRDYYAHPVTIKIGGWKHDIVAGFMEMDHGYGIVGQKGFFDLFIVKFDLLKEQLELVPRSNSKSR